MNRAQLKAVGCTSAIAVSFGDGHWYPVARYGKARIRRPSNQGYSHVKLRGQNIKAHRHFYEKIVGPIHPGLEPDHLCRDRACCAPAHIEPVTHLENTRRGDAGLIGRSKVACKHGHPFDDANTYWRADGTGRRCRACTRQSGRKYEARLRAASGE